MLPITAVFAGLLALWLMFLQSRVVAFRWARRVPLGDGGFDDGMRLIRAHGNAVETIPIFLILLGIAEGLGAPPWVLALAGCLFLLGRVLHGLHFVLDRPGYALRAAGMVLTLVPTGLSALGVLGHALVR